MRQQTKEILSLRFASQGELNYALYFWGVGFSFAAFLLIGIGFAESTEGALNIFLANLVSFGFVLVTILAVDRFWLAADSSRSFGVVTLATAGLFLGAAKGLITAVFLFEAGAEPDLLVAINSRLFQGAILGGLFLPFLALFSTLRLRYEEQRKAIVAERAARNSGTSNYPSSLVSFVQLVRERLSDGKNVEDPALLALELRKIINEDLRPLSHQIWKRENEMLPRLNISQLVRVAIVSKTFSPVLVSVSWLITAFNATIQYHGFDQGFYIAILQAVALAVIFYLASMVKVKNVSSGLIFLLGIVLITGLSQQVIGATVSIDRELFEGTILAWVNVIWILTLTVLFSMARAFLSRGREVQEQMTNLLAEQDGLDAEIALELQLRDRQLAQFLHGDMQSQLANAAARLERLPRNESIEPDRELIDQVLTRALDRFGERQVHSLQDCKKRLKEDWGGFVKIEFNKTTVSLAPEEAEKVWEVINEAIANAVRHGLAEAVVISLAEGPRVTISDDGTGPRGGRPGLGSGYLDSVSQDWELSQGPVGSILRVDLSQTK